MKPRRQGAPEAGYLVPHTRAHVEAECAGCPIVGQRRSSWLSCLRVSMLLLSSCQPPVTPHLLQQTAVGYRFDDPTVAFTPFAGVQWKAILLAGDHSISAISAFDRATEALARLFQNHHIEVIQRFSADLSKMSDKVRLATVAELRHAIPLMQVKPGEGCIVYSTSHGTTDGLKLTQDRSSGNRLTPSILKSIVQAVCGDAPTIIVLSGYYSGMYLRDQTIGPHIILMTASEPIVSYLGATLGRYTHTTTGVFYGHFLRRAPPARSSF